jgi:hypothetical protein
MRPLSLPDGADHPVAVRVLVPERNARMWHAPDAKNARSLRCHANAGSDCSASLRECRSGVAQVTASCATGGQVGTVDSAPRNCWNQ